MCCSMGLQQYSFETLYRAVRAGTPRAPAQQNFYDSVFSGKSAQEARAHLPNKTQLSLHAPDRQFFFRSTVLLGKSLGKLNLVLLITSPVWIQRHAPQFRPPNNKSCLDTTPRAAGIYGNDSFFNCFVALINACALGRFLGA